jgi:hypothetical protein
MDMQHSVCYGSYVIDVVTAHQQSVCSCHDIDIDLHTGGGHECIYNTRVHVDAASQSGNHNRTAGAMAGGC